MLGQVVQEVKAMPSIDDVWVVLGSNLEAVLEMVDLSDCGIIENPEWEDGMATSLRVGLDAINRLSRAETAVVFMGDQPGVSAETVTALCEHAARSKALAVVPKYRYQRGNPVLLRRSLWTRVMSIEGDVGARDFLKAHPEWVEEVRFDELAPRDIDTALDLEQYRPRS